LGNTARLIGCDYLILIPSFQNPAARLLLANFLDYFSTLLFKTIEEIAHGQQHIRKKAFLQGLEENKRPLTIEHQRLGCDFPCYQTLEGGLIPGSRCLFEGFGSINIIQQK
jgi:hypothetical protein